MTRFYATSARLQELTDQLGERDLAILSTLKRLPVATAIQLERLHFGPDQSRSRRHALARLTELRVIQRLERQIGGVRSGSSGFVYSLDIAGQHLVDAGKRRTRKPATPTLLFLQHALDVSELYVRLREQEREGQLELLRFDAEPACWRPFPGPEGAPRLLKSDAYVVVGVGDFEHHWLIEVDRGTHGRSAFIRQLHDYNSYRATGREQQELGLFPRVLITVPNETRFEAVVDWLGTLPPGDWPLFKVTLFEGAVPAMSGGETT